VAPPTLTGGSAVGSTLTCSQGSWASDTVASQLYQAPPSFTFQWSKGSSEIAGANQSTLTASSAGNYSCLVTAQNHAGTATQTSAPHQVVPSTFGPRVLVELSLA